MYILSVFSTFKNVKLFANCLIKRRISEYPKSFPSLFQAKHYSYTPTSQLTDIIPQVRPHSNMNYQQTNGVSISSDPTSKNILSLPINTVRKSPGLTLAN